MAHQNAVAETEVADYLCVLRPGRNRLEGDQPHVNARYRRYRATNAQREI